MNEIRGWQAIAEEVRARIQTREWKPGHLIPNEVDLAYEFGCSRATVNRALQSLAEAGLLDRRRRAGTRVARNPVAKATLDIAMLRTEIEGLGQAYGYALLEQSDKPVSDNLRQLFGSAAQRHVVALHFGDGVPYALEDRWIASDQAPDPAIFDTLSPNEWLLTHRPYTHGDIAFGAVNAEAAASALGCDADAAVFRVERTTWNGEEIITHVRLTFAPGYRMQTVL